MASVNEDMVVKVTEKKGLEVNVYNDYVTLNEVRMGNNDVWYRNWCLPEEWSETKNKFVIDRENGKAKPKNVFMGKLDDIVRIVNELVDKAKDVPF